ncbi:MAG TPA: hypothetical protein VMS71_07865 [Candidatus Acidoferrum sp.]|nr:hypothetical protein [Candidatus Acidoferrum sp.]
MFVLYASLPVLLVVAAVLALARLAAPRGGTTTYLNSLEHLVQRMESCLGRFSPAMLFSTLLMGLAGLYVRPATHCTHNGCLYVWLSQNPFAVHTDVAFPYRILTPLISYLLGLRGQLILVTNLLFSTLLIALTYLYYRTQAARPLDALVGAAAVTFSMTTLSSIYYGGYCDALTYVLVFLMWQCRRRRLLSYVLFLLGMFNRESMLFLLPWFMYLNFVEGEKRWRRLRWDILGFGVALALYVLFRMWIASRQEVVFSLAYYLDPVLKRPLAWFFSSYPQCLLGLFSVFKLLWLFPIAAAISMWRNGEKSGVVSMIILTACASSQLLVAADSSRMLSLGFLLIVISLEHLFRVNPWKIRSWMGWVLMANLFVPQLYTAAHIIELMRPLISQIIQPMPY